MADNVVSLNSPAPRVWVCQCGCASFWILEDGTAECSTCCHKPSDISDGGWKDVDKQKESDIDVPTINIHGNGSVEFARMRMSKLSSDEDARLIVIAKSGGSVHAWSTAETGEQFDWMDEKLASALDMLKRNANG